jgi:hypothetical protein
LANKVADFARFISIETPDLAAKLVDREPEFGDWLKETQDVVADDEDVESIEFFHVQAVALRTLIPSLDIFNGTEACASKMNLAKHFFTKILVQLNQDDIPDPEFKIESSCDDLQSKDALPLDAWYLNFIS